MPILLITIPFPAYAPTADSNQFQIQSNRPPPVIPAHENNFPTTNSHFHSISSLVAKPPFSEDPDCSQMHCARTRRPGTMCVPLQCFITLTPQTHRQSDHQQTAANSRDVRRLNRTNRSKWTEHLYGGAAETW